MINNNRLKKPKQLAGRIEEPKEEIEKLKLPVVTFFAVHVKNGGFDAVELDQYRRVYVYEDVAADLEAWLVSFGKRKNKKVVAVGLGKRHKHSELTSNLWLKHDIVPHIIQQETHNTIEELIQSARLTASLFDSDLAVHPLLYDFNRVIPSYLVNKDDYKETVGKDLWNEFLKQAKMFQGKKLRFFSATPQGGGVALMRHALKRLYRLVDVDVTWHVLYDDPDVFKITKTKFHNVLQNVCPPGTKLEDEEMKLYRQWSRFNANQFRPKFEKADVIVIDDPQPAGLVPYIRRWNKEAKLLYRSHIQVEAHLVDEKGSSQDRTWSFINKLISPAEVFVAHPIEAFVPKRIRRSKVVTMPATTDPLDGLNKDLSREQERFYLGLFNKHLIENGQTPLEVKRDYIVQVARFDPSKGIPDLLEAYRLLCEKLPKRKRPQLVVMGHGSIDDPDGIPILNYVHETIAGDKFAKIAEDIKVARLPHVDQPLNVVLAKAKVATQLSHKEGFEVKVTEALMKGVPVVAYKSGGIPLQIEDGENGFLLPTGNVKAVVDKLYQLMTDEKVYRKVRRGARRGDYSRYQTVMNASSWLFLANQALAGNKNYGHGQSVQELMFR